MQVMLMRLMSKGEYLIVPKGTKFTWPGKLGREIKRGRGRQAEIFALINDSFYMLKKIIKTHTARLDYVDITKPTFLRNAVATNRQRRVIASNK